MSTSDNITAAASGETAAGTMSQAATTDGAILEALKKLDPDNDEHWTNTGKPAMEAVNALLPAAITRARLDEVAPDFSRPEPEAEASAASSGESNAGGAGAEQGGEEPQSGVSHTGGAVEESYTSHEDRIGALEADIAFLRKQFGWPTKND